MYKEPVFPDLRNAGKRGNPKWADSGRWRSAVPFSWQLCRKCGHNCADPDGVLQFGSPISFCDRWYSKNKQAIYFPHPGTGGSGSGKESLHLLLICFEWGGNFPWWTALTTELGYELSKPRMPYCQDDKVPKKRHPCLSEDPIRIGGYWSVFWWIW